MHPDTRHNTASLPRVPADSLPWLSIEQMAEADRLAIEEFDITLLQMMENAGSALAELAIRIAPEGRITVLAGGGNNGGGGLCAARHLINRGRDIEIILASDRPGKAARHHLETLAAMGIVPSEHPTGDIAIDALVGYGLHGQLRERMADLAAWASGRKTISLDFPSGLGHPGAVEPAATLTLALPKESLRDVRPLYVADLGLPKKLWQRLGLDPGNPFAEGRIVEVE